LHPPHLLTGAVALLQLCLGLEVVDRPLVGVLVVLDQAEIEEGAVPGAS